MVQINLALREVGCKVVYYGPGRSGKTTNLEMVHAKAPKDSVGELVSISTETDRTLFFDFLPLNLGSVAGMTTKFALYTVPGQVYYNRTRKLVLQGADGVVFVADSSSKMMEENIESLENLIENLKENGLDIETIPLVLQWNKRDLPDAMPTEEMEQALNRWNAPTCESVAIRGEGVFPALKLVAGQVIKKLNHEYGEGQMGAASPKPAAAPKPAAPAAPKPAAAPAPAPVAPPQPAAPRPKIVPPQAPAQPAVPRPAPAPAAPKPAPAAQAPPPAAPPPPPAAPPPAAPPPRRPEPVAAAARRRAAAEEDDNPIRRELERRRRKAESAASSGEQKKPAAAPPPIKTIRSVQKGRRVHPVVWIIVIIVVAIAVGVGIAWRMGLLS